MAEDEEHKKRSRMQSLLMHVLQSSKKNKLMDDDEEYQDIPQIAKQIVKEQSNREAHEILMITDTVQCRLLQIRNFTYWNVDLFFLEQVKKLRNKLSRTSSIVKLHLHTSAFVFNTTSPERKPLVAAKTSICPTKRVNMTKVQ